MIKIEYVLCMDDLKRKFPINSIQEIDGNKYIVKGYEKPMKSICMASYPKAIFEELKK